MLYLLFILLLLAPQNQQLPDAFYKLPEEVREQATIIVTGSYVQGRGPCIFMADGSRRWALESWFNVAKVYRGKIEGKSIHISSRLTKTEHVSVKLEVGKQYLVLLRPGDESVEAGKGRRSVPSLDVLGDEEIIAILELE